MTHPTEKEVVKALTIVEEFQNTLQKATVDELRDISSDLSSKRRRLKRESDILESLETVVDYELLSRPDFLPF